MPSRGHATTESLHHPREHQVGAALRENAGEAGESEETDADDEDPAVAEAVTHAASGDECQPEGER